MPAAMGLTTNLAFASDAEILGLWGLAFIVLAAVALLGERRRVRRNRIDQVGWMPWTGLFLLSGVIAAALLSLAIKGLIAG